VGGAPPPPQDFAPQGSKNRRNSALLGPDFGGMQTPRIKVRRGGVGGIQATTPARRVRLGRVPATHRRASPQGEDQGIGLGRGLSGPGRSPPNPAGNPPEDHTLVPVRVLGDGAVTGESALIARRSRNSRQFSADTGLRSTRVEHAWTMSVTTFSKQMHRRSRYVATSMLCMEQAPLHARFACYAWEIAPMLWVQRVSVGSVIKVQRWSSGMDLGDGLRTGSWSPPGPPPWGARPAGPGRAGPPGEISREISRGRAGPGRAGRAGPGRPGRPGAPREASPGALPGSPFWDLPGRPIYMYLYY